MARVPRIPPVPIRTQLRGKIQYTVDRGVVVAKKWPRKRPGKKTPAQQEQIEQFTQWVKDLKNILPIEIIAARGFAEQSGYTWRDIISRNSLGRFVIFEPIGDAAMPDFNAQQMLTQLGTTPGQMIVNTMLGWAAFPIGPPGYILAVDIATQLPVWIAPTDTGITQLTGDATAGPGSGSQALTLSNTGVSAGSYTNANITVNAAGRITTAASGSAGSGITQLTGDATAGPGSGSQALTLSNTGVSAGSYTSANITVNAAGRITAASNGSVTGAVVAQATPANPANTNSLVGVMSGFALSFTPNGSGNAFVSINCSCNNNVNGRGAFFGIRYGTGSAPADGAALTGTAAAGGSFSNAMNTNSTIPITAQGIITGLTPGTTYWIDMFRGAVGSGTVGTFNPVINVHEI